MKTLKQFVESTHIDPSLVRAVVRQIGGWEEFKGHAQDITNQGIDGGFSGFIYYNDTVKFTKKHKATILKYAAQMADDIGDGSASQLISGFRCLDLSADEVAEVLYNPKSENKTEVFNALAWFAGEEVAWAYVDALEN